MSTRTNPAFDSTKQLIYKDTDPPKGTGEPEAGDEEEEEKEETRFTPDDDDVVSNIERLTEYTKAFPANTTVWLQLANLYFHHTKDYNKGLQCIKRVLELNPDNTEYLDMYAQGCSMTRQFPEAIQVYEKLLKQSISGATHNHQWFLDLAVVYWEHGKSEAAIDTLKKATTVITSTQDLQLLVSVQYHLIVFLKRAGRHEEAKKRQRAFLEHVMKQVASLEGTSIPSVAKSLMSKLLLQQQQQQSSWSSPTKNTVPGSSESTTAVPDSLVVDAITETPGNTTEPSGHRSLSKDPQTDASSQQRIKQLEDEAVEEIYQMFQDVPNLDTAVKELQSYLHARQRGCGKGRRDDNDRGPVSLSSLVSSGPSYDIQHTLDQEEPEGENEGTSGKQKLRERNAQVAAAKKGQSDRDGSGDSASVQETVKLFEFGRQLVLQGRLDAANLFYTKATQTEYGQQNPTTFYAAGIVNRNLFLQKESAEFFRRAWELEPSNTLYLSDYVHALNQLCEWDQVKTHLPRLFNRMKSNPVPELHPYSLMMYGATQEQIFEQTKRYARGQLNSLISSSNPASSSDHPPVIPVQAWPREQKKHHRDRKKQTTANKKQQQQQQQPGQGRTLVGYISANLVNHAQGTQLLHYFPFHDKTRFQVFIYSIRKATNPAATEIQQRIRGQVEHWVELHSLTDMEAAMRIHQDHVDILIDMTGWVDEPRPGIFAYHPCPIQIEFLGYPGTMGVPHMFDYYVADSVSLPEDMFRSYFTEHIIHLPWTYQVTEHQYEYPLVVTPTTTPEGQPELPRAPTWEEEELNDLSREAKLEKEDQATGVSRQEITDQIPQEIQPRPSFVYCNFNNNVKIDPETFLVWMDILHQVPGSMLWLLNYPADHSEKLSEHARKLGIPRERMHFSGYVSKREHLKRIKAYGDLLLDTPRYNAHTSTGDALWAGLPILTICGKTMAARVCASMIRASGVAELNDLITENYQEYKAKAIDFGQHPEKLVVYRRLIETNRSTMPLFNTQRYVKDFERALDHLWKKFMNGEPAAPFRLKPHQE